MTLTTGHFHPDTVTMLGGFWHKLPTAITPHQTTAPPYKTPTAHRGGEQYNATSQVGVQNPTPLTHLQVGPGFRLSHSMEQAEKATGAPVPQTDDGRPFCLGYHLKGVCNSNCGGRNAHRTLYPHKQGFLSVCKSRFCPASSPVTNIAAPPWAPGGGDSVENTTLSTRSRRSQGSHVTRSRETKVWQTTPPATTGPTLDQNIKTIN